VGAREEDSGKRDAILMSRGSTERKVSSE